MAPNIAIAQGSMKAVSLRASTRLILRDVQPNLRARGVAEAIRRVSLNPNSRHDPRVNAHQSPVRPDILKRLIQAHADGDEQGFRKAAIQLAANEGSAGHSRVAQELRAAIDRLPPLGEAARAAFAPIDLAVDISQPRGDLAGLLNGGFRQERLRDIVLSAETRPRLERLLQENRNRATLEGWGVGPSRKLLFYGPPGCGKTLAAAVVAGELGLPLMTVRFDGLFSRFLGATAGHLKVIFDEMPRRPAVYLFDEFDAVAKSRGDAHDVGEVRRVVTSFLQLTDADNSGSIIIAATNFETLLDRAVFRRFDTILPFPLPSKEQLARLIVMKLAAFAFSPRDARLLANRAVGMSFADAARACDNAIRTMVLAKRAELHPEDIVQAFDDGSARVKLLAAPDSSQLGDENANSPATGAKRAARPQQEKTARRSRKLKNRKSTQPRKRPGGRGKG
jgi:hypothetical protein